MAVFDISGIMVKNWKGDITDKVDIDMQNLHPGIYIVRINDENIKYVYR